MKTNRQVQVTFSGKSFPQGQWVIVGNAAIDSSKIAGLNVVVADVNYTYGTLPVYYTSNDHNIAIYNNLNGPINSASGTVTITLKE